MAKRKRTKKRNSPSSKSLHNHVASPTQKRGSKKLIGFIGSIVASLIASYIFIFSPHSFPSQSVITFKNIPASFSEDVSCRISDAITCFENEKFKESLIHLESGLLSLKFKDSEHLRKQKALINALKGACHLNLKELEEAKNSLEESIKSSPSSFAHKALSETYYRLYQKTQDPTDLEKHKSHSDKAYNLKTTADLIRKNTFNNPTRLDPKNLFVKRLNGKVHLISIGINQYNDSRVKELRYAKNDAKDIIESFENLYSSNLKVHKLIGKNATKDKLFSVINEIKNKMDINDSIIFYYSGHGIKENRLNISKLNSNNSDLQSLLNGFNNDIEEQYILPFDANIDDLKNSTIALSELTSILKSAGTELSPLLIIDACYSNNSNAIINNYKSIANNLLRGIGLSRFGSSNKIETRGLFNLSDPSNVIVIGSSSSGQYAAESSEYQNGVFTHFLISSLNNLGDADQDKDSNISTSELINGIQNKMKLYLSKKGINQDISIN